ncbi:cyclic AMP-responsive element-binding protein 1-like isoform X1 [Xenia sp. Carnegie-2017]|uniref:cyclic AMP-responsive element-binding protein 1-like isoform X1 n=1 Tax=Xenia sp. Carnegie-2017 TaxID=2897299 RepID=UPI001F0382B9|nr:cyclic AMP-responsive element-binding protein 1-like isoform X1 [Xenia sp. Carnegie-2017]
MDQIETPPTTNGNVSEAESSQNVGQQEQFATAQDTQQGTSSIVQATVVQSPQQFSQTAVSVIQPAQASVIQTTTSSAQQIQQIPQAIQFQGVITQDDDLDEEGKKRRDILSRRPSYRKIYDDISDGSIKVEDENGQVMARVATIPGNVIGDQASTQTVTIPQGIQITTQGAFSNASLQTVPISGQSATIVQYPTGQNGQEGQYIYAAAPGDVEVNNQMGINNGATVYAIPTSQTYAVRGSLSPGAAVVLSPSSNLQSSSLGSEDAARKREMRLLKNREAAKECRRKKKEYVKCLENRVAVLENQNKTLIEELKALKDLYCHKGD